MNTILPNYKSAITGYILDTISLSKPEKMRFLAHLSEFNSAQLKKLYNIFKKEKTKLQILQKQETRINTRYQGKIINFIKKAHHIIRQKTKKYATNNIATDIAQAENLLQNL